jgi:hypothetical protein
MRKTSGTMTSAVERGRCAAAGDLLGERAEERARAGAHHHADGVAAHDVGAHEAHVGQLERLAGLRGARVGELLRRHRLAGERGLVDEQVLGFQQAQVRRDHVAGRKPHHVARDERLDRHLDELRTAATPPHARGGLHHGLQARRRVVRAVLLHEGRRHRQHDHDGDHDGRALVAEQPGHDGEHGEQRVERIARPAPQLGGDGRLALARDHIAPVQREAPRRLPRREPRQLRAEARARRLGSEPAQRRELFRLRRGLPARHARAGRRSRLPRSRRG